MEEREGEISGTGAYTKCGDADRSDWRRVVGEERGVGGQVPRVVPHGVLHAPGAWGRGAAAATIAAAQHSASAAP